MGLVELATEEYLRAAGLCVERSILLEVIFTTEVGFAIKNLPRLRTELFAKGSFSVQIFAHLLTTLVVWMLKVD